MTSLDKCINREEMSYSHLPISEFLKIVESNDSVIQKFDFDQITILGGTGFVGKWLVGTLLRINEEFGFNTKINIVTRDTSSAHLALNLRSNMYVNFIQHDFVHGTVLDLPPSDIFFHAATASVPSTGSLDFQSVNLSSMNATNSIITSIMKTQSAPRVINLSSGAVYGLKEVGNKAQFPESPDYGAPSNEYAKTKILIEETLIQAQLANNFYLTNARLFAFAGPHISLNDHFAVGNFMKRSLLGESIQVKGNPETKRSYLYPGDLVSALLRLIPRRDIPFINVGSDEALTIREIAEVFSSEFGDLPIEYLNLDSEASAYIPGIELLRTKLQMNEMLKLHEIIPRWANWIRATS